MVPFILQVMLPSFLVVVLLAVYSHAPLEILTRTRVR
jgi:hypothetical protein